MALEGAYFVARRNFPEMDDITVRRRQKPAVGGEGQLFPPAGRAAGIVPAANDLSRPGLAKHEPVLHRLATGIYAGQDASDECPFGRDGQPAPRNSIIL